jgi:hypothetical protein
MGLFSSIFGLDTDPVDGEARAREIRVPPRARWYYNPAWPVDRYGPTDPDTAERPGQDTPWWRR